MRVFLWSGPDLKYKGAKVSWVDISLPKNEGGLGIKNLEIWNKAVMSKHIWNLIRLDSSSLWVDWVKLYLFRDHSFWDIPIPKSCSWTWRKILKLQPLIRPLIQHIIGDGADTWLWVDEWLPQGPIIQVFDERTVHASQLPRNARVASIINNGTWVWPHANSTYMLALMQSILENMVPNISSKDQVRWKPSVSGYFSTSTAWQAFRSPAPKVTWHKLIWFLAAIPKAGFILWLAIRGRLGTQDRFHIHPLNLSCLLCDGQVEDHDHLFFNCPFSWAIWSEILTKCDIHPVQMPWDQCIDWMV